MPLNIVIGVPEHLARILMSLLCKSNQIEALQHHIPPLLSMEILCDYPDIMFRSATMKNVLNDQPLFYPSQHHIASLQYLSVLLCFLLPHLYATRLPQSSDGIAGAHKAISVFRSRPYSPQLPMKRVQAPCTTLGSSQPPQSRQRGSRDSQEGQKRKSNNSDGSNRGKKAKGSGNDGSNTSKAPSDDKAEKENEKPKKVKPWKEKLFNDDHEQFGCPYFWRRPDMWAKCRCFRRSGEEIHRLKEHLSKHQLFDYVCDTCHQDFELDAQFREHSEKKSCQAKPRNFLLGFDEVQKKQLDPRSEGSCLKGPLDAGIKWKTIYSILFPDAEWSGIPNPLENPETRDVLRWTREDFTNGLRMPSDFNEWRRNQSSTNLILDPQGLNDQSFAWTPETQDTNPTSHSAPSRFDGFTSSGRTEGNEYLSDVGSGNVRRIPSHHMNPVANNLLSPERWHQASSLETGSKERSFQSWGTDSTTYYSGSQNPPGTVQAEPSCRPPDAGQDKLQFDDAQIAASSAADELPQLGSQFQIGCL